MTERNWLEKAGASPAKLALVGVLALALVAVIWHNAAGTAQPIEARRDETPQKDLANRPSLPPQAKSEKVADRGRMDWPKFTLANVVKHDPFAMPTWYLMAQAEEGTAGGSLARSAQVIEELKKVQGRIVVITDQDRMAMLGELSLRVGDTLEGFEVTEITTDGIVLTELPR